MRSRQSAIGISVLVIPVVFALVGLVVGVAVAGVVGDLTLIWDPQARELQRAEAQAMLPINVATAVVVRIAFGGLAFYLCYRLGIALITAIETRARLIYPVGGLFPIVRLQPGETLHDPNRSPAATVQLEQGVVVPTLQPGQLPITMQALDVQNNSARSAFTVMPVNASAPAALPSPDSEPPQAAPTAELPSRVSLRGLLDNEPPTLSRLILGVYLTEEGKIEPITDSMENLVHIAVGGSSGWGKSVFLRSLAYQFALAMEKPDLVGIDLEGVTLGPLAQCTRLLYPIADNKQDAAAILNAVTAELERRKALFTRYPGVDSLKQYNAVADEPLRPLIMLTDEATSLLDDHDIEVAMKTVTLRARKYGLWAVLCGQDWKATSLDTSIRNQLSTRVQFKALSASQSRVLIGQGGAENIEVPGRALAVLPGRGVVELQAPYIGADALLQTLAMGAGARNPIPALPDSESDAAFDVRQKVVELHLSGESDTAIARKVFRHGTTYYIEKVRQILQEQ